jgi:hypothetical protein
MATDHFPEVKGRARASLEGCSWQRRMQGWSSEASWSRKRMAKVLASMFLPSSVYSTESSLGVVGDLMGCPESMKHSHTSQVP